MALAVALSACTADDDATPVVGTSHPRQKASATPAPNNSALQGSTENSGAGVPTVRYVTIDPATVAINAPASDGLAHAGLTTGATFSAQVIMSNSQVDSQGVTWSVSTPNQLSVNQGIVTALPGATAGTLLLTATSVRDNTQKAQAYVTISDDGILSLTVTPGMGRNDIQTLNVYGNGKLVSSQPVYDVTSVRLPSGTYTGQVSRSSDTTSTAGSLSTFTILPNQVQTATATLN